MIQWLIKNWGMLNPKIEKLNWSNEYGLKEFDYKVTITLKKINFEGFGADLNEDIAFTKAIVEAIERFLLFQLGVKNSSGVALHTKKELAIINAKNELIERDLILSHFYTNTPYYFSKENQKLFHRRYKLLIRNLRNDNVNIKIYQLRSNTKVKSFGSLCVISGFNSRLKPFGYILGACVSNKKDFSERKSILEALAMYAHFKNNSKIKAITLKNFNKLKKHTFFDHGKLALNLEYGKNIEAIFSEKSKKNTNKNYDTSKIKVKVVEVNKKYHPLFDFSDSDIKLYAAIAMSDDVQNLFCGNPTKQKINQKRLEEFSAIKFKLNPYPHPFA